MNCVVCGAAIEGEATYANAYEKIRAVSPCCSAACSQRFDPDKHWMPGQRPKELDDDERNRLLRVLRERLASDQPVVVVREMLVAGLPPRLIRLQLGERGEANAKAHADAERKTLWGAILGVFTGHYKVSSARDQRRPEAFEAAARSIDEWERVYPS